MKRDLVLLKKSDLLALPVSAKVKKQLEALFEDSEDDSLNPKNIGEFLWYAASFIDTENEMGRTNVLAKNARDGLERFSKKLMETYQ